MVKIYCSSCGRRLLTLRKTAAGFRLALQPSVRMESVIEHGDARFLVSCWCPGERAQGDLHLTDKAISASDRERFRMRSYVMTVAALMAAWQSGITVIKLGDAVLAGKIR